MSSLPSDDPWQWQPPQPCRWQQPVSLIRLDGPGVLRFLHGQTSQDLERAVAGQCLATCCITPTARLRGLAEVLVDATGAWLVITAGDGGSIHQAFDRVLFPADQVALGGPVAAVMHSVLGAAGILAAAGMGAIPQGRWTALGPEPGQGWLLPDPNRILLTADQPAPAWLEALPVLSRLDQQRWRLQQGLPQEPTEINEDLNPFELGLAERVSLSKGCYVGQETLAKLATYDGVKQQLRRWTWSPDQDPEPAAAPETPAPGIPLIDAAGQRAGWISSSLELPASAGRPRRLIGLALVRRQALGEATLLADSLPLSISAPAGFRAPPVGAGGGASGRGS
ncbi:MAG: folate-binding protein [Cyanobium sp.]|nr:MAG: folate-binding protein [Cyanobium sp.]